MLTVRLLDHQDRFPPTWRFHRWRAYYRGSLFAFSAFLGRRELLVVVGYWWRPT